MSDEHKSKYITIAEQIKADILSGVYAEGDAIPTIRQLATRYHVNPQTVNKATAYLASIGYLQSRQGSGSVVVRPQNAESTLQIPMLLDRRRSRQLSDLDDPRNYHSKDIYLTYLVEMSQRSEAPGFLVYDKSDTRVKEEIRNRYPDVRGLFVQGTLPQCYFDEFAERNIPVVLINREVPDGFSGRAGSVLISPTRLHSMVDYLVTMGHRKLLYAFSTEFEKYELYHARLSHIRSALGEWSEDFSLELRPFDFDLQDSGAQRELERLLDEGFTAAIGYNDVSALSLFGLVQRAGRSVPYDLSVVGFDDMFAARIATPPLTTIRVNRARLVTEAFGIMDQLRELSAPNILRETIDTELVIRKSALPPKTHK